MPIIYSCVAHKDVILAEFTTRTGNFNKVIKRILEQIPNHDNKMSYVFEQHYFHYVVADGITYLCMSEEAFGRRIPFAFLDDIKNRFKATYGDRGRSAIAYAMQSDFSRILQKQMDYYSNNENADRIMQVRKGLDEVKGIMINNIERVLERGEKIELLVDKTEHLTSTSVQFKKKSTELKHAMWWQNTKLILLIVGICAVILFLIIWFACGFPTFKNCAIAPYPHPAPPPAPTPTPTETPTTS